MSDVPFCLEYHRAQGIDAPVAIQWGHSNMASI